jgi:glycosyltransferase involved in cell wall biosynthesis
MAHMRARPSLHSAEDGASFDAQFSAKTSDKKPGPRVALVTNVLARYRVPCFSELAARMPGQVTFFLLAETMEHRRYVMAAGIPDGLPIVTLKGCRWSHPPYDDLHVNDVRPVIFGGYDTIILGAWDEPTYLLLWAWGIATGKKVVFWIESTAYELPRSSWKELYKRILMNRAAGCIVPGKRALEYCRNLGMPEDRIFVAPNAADREYFGRQAQRLGPHRDQLRAELGLSGTVVLFVGRFVESYKDVMTLIEAAASVEPDSSINLILAGDGPDRLTYREWIAGNACTNVRFVGELDHDSLCEYYAAVDVIALPSKSETWGFVLNEAMEFGLPIVVSNAVGAGPDLVKCGKNGFVTPAGDPNCLAGVLKQLDADADMRMRMGSASRKIIGSFSPQRWAAATLEAINAISSGRREARA